ncbi:MAG: HAD hydrolase-like protein [Lachnospiraceae bacterium]|nr:HAD hydrolase-like protein [Lachnospiraceae bacterium]
MKTLFFDLDGTLINSEPGITKCVQYALDAFGIEENNMDRLRRFIGPPLFDSFCKYYDFDEKKAREAVAKYRERYHVTGIYECELYPGVKKELARLKQDGYQIAMASSKPESSCMTILKHFGIDSLFDEVVGATMDGSRDSKIQVLEEAMRRMEIKDRTQAVLIGDTRFDVDGAKQAGMDCIGVSYGFGSEEELLSHGAIAVCHTMKEVREYIEHEI